MKLHRFTIEALEHKAAVAADTYEPADPETACWQFTEGECLAAVKGGTVEALKACRTAQAELENYLGSDMPQNERRAIERDLCRAGWYEIHNPEAVCTRRLRTLTVDGIRYDVG